MRCSSISLLCLAACTGAISPGPTPEPVAPPEMILITGRAVDGMRAERSQPGPMEAAAVWLQAGHAAVLGDGAAHIWNDTAFADLVIGTPDDLRGPGTITAVGRRREGVVLASTGGFFHDAPGRLLRAPLSDSFDQERVRFIDSAGDALWVTTPEGAWRVLGGRRETLHVNDADEEGAVQVVVGRSSTIALLVQGASLYQIDLEAQTAQTLARGVTRVTSLAHHGPVTLLGTDTGLLEVLADGTVRRRTLTDDDVGQPVLDVESEAGEAMVSTTTQVLQVFTTQVSVLADATPRADGLVRDDRGDVWFLDGARLTRLATSLMPPIKPPDEPPPTPPAPTYEADVQPFMAAHCRSCHATGAHYAPVINFESYAVARNWARTIKTRVSDPLAPMPPSSSETLTPAQVDVVSRWVEGGMLP